MESAADLAGLYRDFGLAGTLTLAATGTAPPVLVLLDAPEAVELGGKVLVSAPKARLVAASLPARPVRGDLLQLADGRRFNVASARPDASGAELLVTLTT